MGRVVKVAQLPSCDFCAKEDVVTPAIVDGRVAGGGWAYMCSEHRKRWSEAGPQPPGESPLENPLVLEETTPDPPAPGTVGAVAAQIKRDDFMREALKNPPYNRIELMVFDGVPCEAVDGCVTDPDGQCEHGYPSWLVALGMI